MVNKAPNFKLGDTLEEGRETMVVEYDGADIAPGDALKVTGVNAAQQLIVQKHTGNSECLAVAIYAGKDGLITEVLIRGTVHVKFGSATVAGVSVSVQANKFVAHGGGSSENCAISISAADADDDQGLIFFNGFVGRHGA